MDGVRPLLRRYHGRNVSEPLHSTRCPNRSDHQLDDGINPPYDLGPARFQRLHQTLLLCGCPFVALWGSKYLDISKPFSTFLADCQTGSLPNVSFIDPKFLDEDTGTSADDHPHADIRDGEQFLNQIYNAVRTSPNWSSTVLVINFDEWGGFYDHVPPPVRLPVPAIQAAVGDLDGRIGFRVPCVIISPFARHGYVAKEQYDHTSVLKMIEWRLGLAPLTERDRDANNLAEALDFAQPDFPTDAYTVPSGYLSPPCLPSGTPAELEFNQLRTVASQLGFPGF